MDQYVVRQLENLTNLLRKNNELLSTNFSLEKDLYGYIEVISESLLSISKSINHYESAITNQTWFIFLLGALTTFFVNWFFEFIKERKKQREYLYYLLRQIVDQMNLVIDVHRNIVEFLDDKIPTLVKFIEETPSNSYSVATAFLPLFAVRSLPDEILSISSGSNYIDNLVGKVYSLSKDFPYLIDDVRNQFKYTIDIQHQGAYSKANSPEEQKRQFKKNIMQFEEMVRKDVLKNNFNLYLKKFAELKIATENKIRFSKITWRFKFDPRYKFFLSREEYVNAKETSGDYIEKYFNDSVKKEFDYYLSLIDKKQ